MREGLFMRLVYFDKSRLSTEDNTVFDIRYYLTVDDIVCGEALLFENYGIFIEILKDDQIIETEMLPGITPFLSTIEDIANIAAGNAVTPSTIKDVVLDYLS